MRLFLAILFFYFGLYFEILLAKAAPIPMEAPVIKIVLFVKYFWIWVSWFGLNNFFKMK
jgi:hypothetical protein